MSAATETTGMELVLPVLGEVLPLDAPTDRLAEATWRMRELETELARVRRIVGQELIQRMDKDNLRKAEVGGYSVSVDAPGGLEWDAAALDRTLEQLVEGGVISEFARRSIVVMKPSVSQKELKKLLATLDSPDKELVEACSSPSRRSRRVKVDNEMLKAEVRNRR